MVVRKFQILRNPYGRMGVTGSCHGRGSIDNVYIFPNTTERTPIIYKKNILLRVQDEIGKINITIWEIVCIVIV